MSDLTNTFRASGLIAAFAFLICLFAVQSAQAQLTLTVTRTDDRNTACVSGVDCSLREAVNTANAS
jgi:CSLREA domain-containing protein